MELIYKVMHLAGVMMLFLGLGGAIIRSANKANRGRIIAGITSGTGLLLILISGFGMMVGWPFWIILKIVIWVAIGASIALINRKPRLGLILWISLIILGAFAAYLGVYQVASFG